MVAKKKTTKKKSTKSTKKKTATKKVTKKVKATTEKKKVSKKKTSVPKKTKEATTTTKKNLSSGKFLYFFGGGKAEGNAGMKDQLGGKGANLAEMTSIGVPVPPGFTISTDTCKLFYENNMEIPRELEEAMKEYVKKIEKETGTGFGDPENPLLVSVRSGAKFSMPGMMDTILNLGLNEDTLNGIVEKTNDMRFALDNYRRFIAMFGDVVLGIDKQLFEDVITKKKKDKRIKQDSSLQANDLKDIVKKYKSIIKRKTGDAFPDDPWEQLKLARDAVFRS
ncbi:MAG: PEP/pyruvate-binding domain-containing protein, partial [candidate division Zixibacteria bacterium]|nr:PEP/pyruvate-binding domain-containing protein [candidate division Zixibacteria bacterium]